MSDSTGGGGPAGSGTAGRPRYVAPDRRRAMVGRAAWRAVFRTFYRTEIVDAHLVPATGAVIMAANHSGLIDGPVVMGLAPRAAHFMVKKEMFHGISGVILRAVGQIPVDRTVADRTAIGTTLAVLSRGDVVGVFPEGSRGAGDVAAVHAGVTFLALASGAPVVPVACLGTRPAGGGPGRLVRPFSRLAVVFGESFTLQAPAGVPRREANRLLTEELRQRLAAHVHASSARMGIPLVGEHGLVPHAGVPAEAVSAGPASSDPAHLDASPAPAVVADPDAKPVEDSP